MNKNSVLRDKAIAAFKGFINTYKLATIKSRVYDDTEYLASWRTFQSDEEIFELVYKKWKYERVLNLVDRLYPEQTDTQFVHKCLLDTTTEWIEQGHDKDDQSQLEQAAENFLRKVESGIKSLVLYIPINGLNVQTHKGLKLGYCHLHSNTPDSELMLLVQRDRERLPNRPDKLFNGYEQAPPAFFKVKLSGHPKQAMEKSKQEAELAFNIIRLYKCSFYFDIYQRPQVSRRMGLMGTIISGRHSSILYIRDDIPIDEQYPGRSEKHKHVKPFELSSEDIQKMKQNGLDRINTYLRTLKIKRSMDVAPRLLRAINWFGKASTANSIVDSYMMYAISVESMISEGNTPKETYAKRIAALLTRQTKIELVGGYLSQELGKRLKAAEQGNDQYDLIVERSIELFSHRNDVAHGRVLDGDVDIAKLIDFEFLARNFILSFVCSGWNTLEEFKKWVDSVA